MPDRAEHPFHMYDAICAQPATFAQICGNNPSPLGQYRRRVLEAERIFLCGTGTSFHAARLGECLLQGALAGRMQVRQAFDLAVYGPQLSARDVVIIISHRGSKTYGLRCAVRARGAGALAVAIVGKGSGYNMAADVALETVEQELSSAHTISFTGAVAMLAALARELLPAGGADAWPSDLLEVTVPRALESALTCETKAARLAAGMSRARRIWIVGAGPDEAVAREGALKIMETSYLTAEGWHAEEVLHGPFQSADAADWFVLLANPGPGRSRVLAAAPMIQEIGAGLAVIGDEEACTAARNSVTLEVPVLPAPFSSLVAAVLLQLLSYHIALCRGTNPDNFRLSDPRFARAAKLAAL